jgi:hypothetical protein
VSSIALFPSLTSCWSIYFLVLMISVYLLLLCFRNIEVLVGLENDLCGSVFLLNILLTCQDAFQIVQCAIALAHLHVVCNIFCVITFLIRYKYYMFSFRNEMVCSSMDNIMHPGLHADVLPGLQDSYGLAFSDFLSADIACYPLMQPDHHAGIGASDSEVRLPGTLI